MHGTKSILMVRICWVSGWVLSRRGSTVFVIIVDMYKSLSTVRVLAGS
jgi:hypothetical protein